MRHGVNPARLPDVDPGTADELAHKAFLAEDPDTT
jgi:hypothetical protein